MTHSFPTRLSSDLRKPYPLPQYVAVLVVAQIKVGIAHPLREGLDAVRHFSVFAGHDDLFRRRLGEGRGNGQWRKSDAECAYHCEGTGIDRKSTRLNSSH